MKNLPTGSVRSLLAAGLLAIGFAAPADAQMSCRIRLDIVKGGFIVGVAGGSGTLTCNGKSYRLSIGGVKAGLLIGASRATLAGRVENLHRIRDIEGVYSGAGAGVTVGTGVGGVAVVNTHGVRLVLRGRQVGLEGSVDLSGSAISLRR